MSEPAASCPHVPGYGIPKTIEGTLPWSHVTERLERARHYWVATSSPDGHPHAVPVWGVWVDHTLCFGGGQDVRWVRNLAANPYVAVHLESGEDVVILEGRVERIADEKHPLEVKGAAASQAKYGMSNEDTFEPFWALRPRKVIAWTQFPTDATRWVFEEA